MRPYWAVLKDSFREALASRVLVILLAISTLALLLLVAPISMKQEPVPVTSAADLIDAPGLVSDWLLQKDSHRQTPGKHLWSLLSEEQQAQLAEWNEHPLPPAAVGQFAALVESLLARPEVYDASSWRGVETSRTATQLLERGAARLTPDELRRANRLLLEGAFRGRLSESHADALYFNYFGWSLGRTLGIHIERHDLERVVQAILTSVMSFFVGTLGVFAAILVTSTFVPQMFEAGSVDLLFSKPVSRSLLFLTRFFGAGAFIALNAGYFVLGLWLITGLRFGVWSGRLLLCIPLFLFAFLVYYSVCAAAGVVWRNAIVAVIITVLFWGVCSGIQVTQSLFDTFAAGPSRMVKLVPLPEGLMALDTRGNLFSWDAAASDWKTRQDAAQRPGQPPEPPGQANFRRPPIGPLYHPDGRRLLNIESRGGAISESKASDDWAARPLGQAPEGSGALFLNRAGEPLVVGRKGVFRLKDDGGFDRVSDESLAFTFPAAALDASDDAVLVYSRGRLYRLAPDAEGRYTLAAERDLETAERGLLAAAGGRLLLALENGRTLLLDGATLETQCEQQPEKRTPPRFVYSSPGSQALAVLFHNQRLWICDASQQALVEAPIVGQRDISAAAFAEDGSLLAADRGRRVRGYSAGLASIEKTYAPRLAVWERIYYYFVRPLYGFFPIPSRIEEVMVYLLQDRSTQQVGDDLTVAQVQIDVARPLVTNSVFMAIVLGLTCWYISRRDF